jgi:phosphoglycerate dehydrogenase-like enzyme
MSADTAVAVTSRSFSRHPVLRDELLARYPNTTFNDEGLSLRGDELAAFLAGKERAITALEPIDDPLLERLPDLRLISKIGVGTDMIDQDALRRRGVELRVHAGTNSRSVAELVLAFAIALLRHVPQGQAELAAGQWRQVKGRTLSGRTVGIVGYGHVGRDLAGLLAPFGCEVLAHDVQALDGVEQVKLDELLRRSDVVSLHVGLNDATRGMIDAAALALMRPDAVLINTARGGLVDERALAEALREGRLGGAGFDVYAVEPPEDRALLELPNFLGTPHIGGSTEEAILAMGRAAIAGLDG